MVALSATSKAVRRVKRRDGMRRTLGRGYDIATVLAHLNVSARAPVA
jgi:hypothetical protein